jgi:hypothetical protein
MSSEAAKQLGQLSARKRREKLGEQGFRQAMQQMAKLPRKKRDAKP